MCQPNLKSAALPVPEIMAIEVLGAVNPNLGEEEAVGGRVGDGTVRKSVGDFLYALYSNLSAIFTRFRDIASFVLQHATFPHPTSSLPKISAPSLGVGGWPLGYEERRCLANCPCN